MITEVAQRYPPPETPKARRPVYVPARGVIVPSWYDVEEIADDTTAKRFVLEIHYSGSYPAARFRFGLYRAGRLVGVAVFSQPMQDKVLDCLPKGKDEESRVEGPWLRRGRFGTEDTTNRVVTVLPGHPLESTELGRLVLLDEEPGNAESYFVTRCFEKLRAKGITGVVSFSDPTPRRDVDGFVVFGGHIGFVYQAMNAVYVGRASPRTLKMLADGTVLVDRALSKVRNQERGHDHVEKLLLRNGARARRRNEDPRTWLAKWLPRITRNVRNKGNHKYLFGLTESVKRRLPASTAYPKFNLGAAS